jgi:hypothetical protein
MPEIVLPRSCVLPASQGRKDHFVSGVAESPPRYEKQQYADVKRWYLTIANRSAVQRGYHVPKKVQDIPMP